MSQLCTASLEQRFLTLSHAAILHILTMYAAALAAFNHPTVSIASDHLPTIYIWGKHTGQGDLSSKRALRVLSFKVWISGPLCT